MRTLRYIFGCIIAFLAVMAFFPAAYAGDRAGMIAGGILFAVAVIVGPSDKIEIIETWQPVVLEQRWVDRRVRSGFWGTVVFLFVLGWIIFSGARH